MKKWDISRLLYLWLLSALVPEDGYSKKAVNFFDSVVQPLGLLDAVDYSPTWNFLPWRHSTRQIVQPLVVENDPFISSRHCSSRQQSQTGSRHENMETTTDDLDLTLEDSELIDLLWRNDAIADKEGLNLQLDVQQEMELSFLSDAKVAPSPINFLPFDLEDVDTKENILIERLSEQFDAQESSSRQDPEDPLLNVLRSVGLSIEQVNVTNGPNAMLRPENETNILSNFAAHEFDSILSEFDEKVFDWPMINDFPSTQDCSYSEVNCGLSVDSGFDDLSFDLSNPNAIQHEVEVEVQANNSFSRSTILKAKSVGNHSPTSFISHSPRPSTAVFVPSFSPQADFNRQYPDLATALRDHDYVQMDRPCSSTAFFVVCGSSNSEREYDDRSSGDLFTRVQPESPSDHDLEEERVLGKILPWKKEEEPEDEDIEMDEEEDEYKSQFAGSSTGYKKDQDEALALSYELPLSAHEICYMSNAQYNDFLRSCKLSKAQLAVLKQIRRRGRNKLAARTSRMKRDMAVDGLAESVQRLQPTLQQLKGEERRLENAVQKEESIVSKLLQVVAGINSVDPGQLKLLVDDNGDIILLCNSEESQAP